jgi:hypothetical protein
MSGSNVSFRFAAKAKASARVAATFAGLAVISPSQLTDEDILRSLACLGSLACLARCRLPVWPNYFRLHQKPRSRRLVYPLAPRRGPTSRTL